MSGIYAYVVLPRDVEPPPGLEGPGGEPIRRRALDRIWVWYSSASSCPSPTLESIRSHHAVAEAAMQEGVTPLPLRFGQWFAGEQEFVHAMEEKEASYRRLLKEVAGCLEFGLRVIEPGGEEPAAAGEEAAADGNGSRRHSLEDPEFDASGGPGAAHLRALARSRRTERESRERAGEVGAEIGERFSDVVRRQRIEPLPRGGGLVSIAQLVPRAAIAEYHDRVRDVRRGSRTLRFVVSGPWPPYSFVQ